MYKQKTTVLTEQEASEKNWIHLDATNETLGRLASRIALILRGKNKPQFTPNLDSGDYVVVTNVEKISLTGKKWSDKLYFWHTNHIGGIKKRTAQEQLEKHPEKLLYDAVQGMLPKNSLGRAQLTKLRLFVGSNHEHQAQQPQTMKITKE